MRDGRGSDLIGQSIILFLVSNRLQSSSVILGDSTRMCDCNRAPISQKPAIEELNQCEWWTANTSVIDDQTSGTVFH